MVKLASCQKMKVFLEFEANCLFVFFALAICIDLSARFTSDGAVVSDRRFAFSAVLYNICSEYTHLNHL